MAKFSTRHGYDSRDAEPPKVEDAPEWVRIAYLNGVLNALTFVDHDSRYKSEHDRPLGIKDLAEPGIRHGGTVRSTLSLADAEFCFHVGVALIRYMMSKHEASA